MWTGFSRRGFSAKSDMRRPSESLKSGRGRDAATVSLAGVFGSGGSELGWPAETAMASASAFFDQRVELRDLDGVLALFTLTEAEDVGVVGRAAAVEEECRTLEGSGGIIGSIVIELDGPGVSAYDALKRAAESGGDTTYGKEPTT